MKLLIVGDVIAKVGRQALRRHLPKLRRDNDVSFCIVNAENSAGGAGVTRDTARELYDAGADCLTTGNHVWDKKEIVPYIDEDPRLLRPANYPAPCPGAGLYVGTTEEGVRVAVMNIMGRVHMNLLDEPFRTADRLVDGLRGKADVTVLDFHAEVTSEKAAMGWYLDGRVSVVFGTHTHIPTADERILPGGTAYQTDVGMTGPYDSVIGMQVEGALQRFLTQRHHRLEPAENNVQVRATLVDVDETTGKARSIRRLSVQDGA
jgi:metallophosphoesterase (TIGR00282 family)